MSTSYVMRARHPAWFKEDLERLFGLLASGAIRPRVAERISFDEVAEAHRRLEAGGLEGKLVLCPDLTSRRNGALPSPHWVAFERRMNELGYREGRNFSFDFLQAASADEYEVLYQKLAARELDVIIAIGPEVGLRSALAVTRTVPIVMVAIDYDPLGLGYVTSLARPSGNVTGVVFQQIELAAKRIQLIRDAFPDRPAATMFWDKVSADQWEAARSTAVTFGLQLSGIELRELPYDYESALNQAPRDHRGTLIVPTSPSFFRDRARLADFTIRHRLLSMFVFREWVDEGGLLCYGPSITAIFARVAEFVDRIARGARPADLPIEQPTKFEMVANLKTAKAIGIELPTAILLRADEVIE